VLADSQASENIANHLREQNPDAVKARQPGAKKAHSHGLWSIGPNEEWGVDGHEKLTQSMGISIWGVADKFTRMEMSLYATPNARVQELPPALYLRTCKKWGGTLILHFTTSLFQLLTYSPGRHVPHHNHGQGY
jgi:hypothetical protein